MGREGQREREKRRSDGGAERGDGRETAGWGRVCYRPRSAARPLSVRVGSPSRSFRNAVSVTLRVRFHSLFLSLSPPLYLSLSVSPSLPRPRSPFATRPSTRASLPLPSPPRQRHRVPPQREAQLHGFLRSEARPRFSVVPVLRFMCVKCASVIEKYE